MIHNIPNTYTTGADTTTITMRATGGDVVAVLIDAEDQSRAETVVWHVQRQSKVSEMVYSKDQSTTLHRFILQVPRTTLVTPRNGSYLDCRKANLRRGDIQEYEVRGDTAALFLYRKDGSVAEALIDVDDLPRALASPAPWYVLREGRHGERVACDTSSTPRHSVYLHRWLLDAQEDMVADHINGNGLDNRRKNLRGITQPQNVQNRRHNHIHNKSGERGVWWDAKRQSWLAYLTVGGRRTVLGRYEHHEDAVRVVRIARAQLMPFSLEAENSALVSADLMEAMSRRLRSRDRKDNAAQRTQKFLDSLRGEVS